MDIKKVIKTHGFTISEVATKMPNGNGGIGISQPSLSAIINGNPTINRLKDIADIIGISISELVADSDRPEQSSTTADSARLEQRIGRLETMVGEILEELRKQHQADEATADSLASAIAEIKQKVSDTHQDLRYNAKNIMAECEGISQDFRDLFSLLDDKLC